MKATKVFFTATALVGLNLLAVQVRAQTTPTTTYIPATTIVGSHVTGPEGDQVGAITNVILDRQTGCMAYVVLSTQSAGARKAVAVPWSVFSPGSDTHTYTVRVAREKIDKAPVWEASNLEEYNRSDWIGNLYAYYGAQPGGADRADIRSASADREERRRQRREQRMERNPPDHYRNADVRMERERGRRGMRERPAAEPTATPTASESPTPRPSPSSNPGSQPHEGASITPSATPSATRNPDELRPPPAGEGPTASPKPGS